MIMIMNKLMMMRWMLWVSLTMTRRMAVFVLVSNRNLSNDYYVVRAHFSRRRHIQMRHP